MKQMISFDKFYKKYDLIGNMSTMLLQTYSDDEPNYSMLTETLEKNISKFSFFKESEKLMRDQQLQYGKKKHHKTLHATERSSSIKATFNSIVLPFEIYKKHWLRISVMVSIG